eukprot:TRINITY_DN33575_c0_g1_i1.p1 TRINITY_DN33575_c0_g1~~TRINITY_DN33575_c0_g1_i1.p1  ORF type:complete len:521 (+),score=76.43 TRINITY_DN33575_c0_g1_i1:192-1565(+)
MGERPDWRAQLKTAVDDLGFKGIRFHGIFDDEMNVVTGTWDNPSYNWTQVDNLVDYLLELKLRPIMELSFMPSVIANCVPNLNCSTQFAYNLVKMPPWQERWYLWHNLVKEFVTHLTARYGENEIATWRFEVWNEMWGINFPSQYMPLFNASATAVRSVSSKYRVGGPTTMELLYLPQFYNLSKTNGKTDFITSHFYPMDACLGKADRDCFSDSIVQAKASLPADAPPFYITEYSSGWKDGDFRLSTYFGSSFFIYHIPRVLKTLDVYSWWCFSDVFMEAGMPTGEWEGQSMGLQTLYGVAKPSFRAHQLLTDAGDVQLSVGQDVSPRESGVQVFATTNSSSNSPTKGLRIVVTFYDFPDQVSFDGVAINTTTVRVSIPSGDSLPSVATLTTINSTCANAYDGWKSIGSPPHPDSQQLSLLKEFSIPCTESIVISKSNGEAYFTVSLESYAVVLVTF